MSGETNSADYQAYEIRGTHTEIGRQMAAFHRGVGGPPLSAEQREFASACRTALGLVHPPLLDEIAAHAAAAGASVDDTLFSHSLGMTVRGAPASGACSTLGVMTPSGPVVARNYDFFFWATTRHLISAFPEGYPAHKGMYDGLLAGRHDGLNDRGLFASLHFVGTRPLTHYRPGLFCVHVLRVAIEKCGTVREAVEVIAALPHLASYAYFLADPKDMVVVEAHASGQVRVRQCQRSAGYLLCTNHYLHPDMVPLGLSPAPSHSLARYRRLEAAGREAAGLAAPKATTLLRQAMADHTAPVCGHVDGLATLWSALASPGEGQVSYALGPPCRNEYRW